MPQVIPSIFKQFEISGLYPGELNEGSAYVLGRAFAQVIRARKVLVGRDARPSSDTLAQSFERGLLQEGVDVFDIGWVTEPYISFACQQADYDGSVFVTSHEPSLAIGGFILTRARGVPLTATSGLHDIRDLVRKGVPDYRVPPGQFVQKDYSSIYLETLTRQRVIKHYTVAADTGNGMAGLTIPAIMARLPQIKVVPLYFEINGQLPNRVADPLNPESLIKLKGAVRMSKCDLGVAFNANGDQVVIVTAQGELVQPDWIGILLAQRQLLKHPGGTVLHNVHSSWLTSEEIKKAGGKPIGVNVRAGDLKQAMRTHQAVFGFDSSAHYWFKDFYNTANADVALLELLELLSEAKRPLQELIAPFKKYMQSGDIVLHVTDTASVLEAMARHFAGLQQTTVDGLEIEQADWRLTVEPYQNLVRIALEAKSSAVLKEKRNELAELLQPFSAA